MHGNVYYVINSQLSVVVRMLFRCGVKKKKVFWVEKGERKKQQIIPGLPDKISC